MTFKNINSYHILNKYILMEFKINILNTINNLYFHATALYLAVESENTELVKILLSNPNININSGYVYLKKYLMQFQI